MELLTETRRTELETRGGVLYRTALQEMRQLTAEEQGELRKIEGELDRDDYKRMHPADPAQRRFTAGIETRDHKPKFLTAEHRMVDFAKGSYAPEQDQLNFGKYFRGLLTGNWHEADAERRAMSEGTATAGGHMVPTPLSTSIIDKMRNQAVIFRAGAITVPMTSQTLKFARLTTDPTGAWTAENTTISASDAVFDSVTFTARKLAALVKMSVELVEDAPNATEVVENAIAESLALELDRVALYGSGTPPEPRGIFNDANVPVVSMGTNGAALTDYDELLDAVFTVIANNGTPKAAIYAPRTAAVIEKWKDSQNQPLVAPPSWAALTKLVSNQVSITSTQGSATNASSVFVGDFATVGVGMRTQLMLEASREAGTAFADGQVWIRAYLRSDVQVLQPKKLATLKGVIPA